MIDYAKNQGSQVKCEGACGQTMAIDYTTVIEHNGPHDLITVCDGCKDTQFLMQELDASEITVILSGKECGTLIALAALCGMQKNCLPEIHSARNRLLIACAEKMSELKNTSVLDSDLIFEPSGKHGIK